MNEKTRRVSWEFGEQGGVENAWLRYRCPCCGGEGALPIRGRAVTPLQQWDWDGNREAPTLSPSILRSRTCGWHGYLRAGVLVKA